MGTALLMLAVFFHLYVEGPTPGGYPVAIVEPYQGQLLFVHVRPPGELA